MATTKEREFDERLQQAAKTELSSEEIREQTVSFVMGTTSNEHAVTREQVRELVAKQFGR